MTDIAELKRRARRKLHKLLDAEEARMERHFSGCHYNGPSCGFCHQRTRLRARVELLAELIREFGGRA